MRLRGSIDIATFSSSVANDGIGVEEMNDPMTIYATAIYSAGVIAVLGSIAGH